MLRVPGPPDSFFKPLTFDDIENVSGLPLDAPRFWELEENLEGVEQMDSIDRMKSMLKWLPEERQSAKTCFNSDGSVPVHPKANRGKLLKQH